MDTVDLPSIYINTVGARYLLKLCSSLLLEPPKPFNSQFPPNTPIKDISHSIFQIRTHELNNPNTAGSFSSSS